MTRRGKTIRARGLAITGVLAVAALAIIPAARAQDANATQPHGCESARGGVRHHADGQLISQAPGVLPCLTTTFPDYGEANIVETSSGAVMHGSAYDPNPGGAGISGGVARTVDKGSHWQDVAFPPRSVPPETQRGSGDPQLWRDPTTNRIYYTTIGGLDFPTETLLCQTDLSYSDDNGATWVNNPDPPLWGCPAFDFPRPFTGPPRTSTIPAGDYPNVLYICKASHTVPERQCWKSLDGGKTFDEIGGSPGADTAGTMGAWTADLAGNLYGVASSNLNVSVDEGITWASNPVPGGFDSSKPVVDGAGNVYLAAIVDNLPAVTYTTDRGTTWSAPVRVQMPGVNHVDQVALAAGKPGQIAVSYVGNSDHSDATDVPPYHRGGVHHGYLTTTSTNAADNLFAGSSATPTPVFTSVQVDSDQDPLLPYGFPAISNTSTAPSARADYIGVDIGPDGAPWAYFYKDMCQAPATCGTTNSSSPLYNTFTNWMGAVATIGKPSAG